MVFLNKDAGLFPSYFCGETFSYGFQLSIVNPLMNCTLDAFVIPSKHALVNWDILA